MAGFRTRRKTNDQNYTGVNGTLTLPNALQAHPQTGVVKDGVFPQFFYNFYNGPVNIDIGLYYTGSGWKVFANSPNIDYVGGWKQYSCSLSAGQTVQIAAYPKGTSLIVLKLNNQEYAFNLKPGVNVWSGCAIAREMNLVAQSSPDKCSYKKTNAYFKNAQWYSTTLNHKNGSYVNLSASNSQTDTDMDSNDPADFEAVCVDFLKIGTGTNTVLDNVTIDFRLSQLC